MTTTASTPSADKVHQIQATTTPEGEVRFALPIKPELIESVEAIDLDLMLTTTSGEKYILQQGALLATTNTESKLVFSNGDAMSAADQMKRMGVMKPVEGGSFRLASALTPEMAEKVTGNEFGLGKDAQDTVAKIEKIIQALETATQSSQSSDANSAQGLGKNSAFKSNADQLASAAAGAPPKPENKFTSDNTGRVNATTQDISGDSTPKIKEVVTESGKAFASISIREMLADSPLKVKVVDGAGPSIANWGEHQVKSALVIAGVSSSTDPKVTLTLIGDASKLPPGFLVDGKSLAGGSVTLSST